MGVSPASLEAAGGIGGLLAVHDAAVPGAGTGGGVGPADYVYFYEANGNVAQVVDLYAATPAAAIKVKYEYDPYGQRTNAAAAGEYDQPFRFSTKPFDAETGLSYYGYRYHNAKLGRWMSRDRIEEGGGVNLLRALGNRPLASADALGLDELQCVVSPQGHVSLQARCVSTSSWRTVGALRSDMPGYVRLWGSKAGGGTCTIAAAVKFAQSRSCYVESSGMAGMGSCTIRCKGKNCDAGVDWEKFADTHCIPDDWRNRTMGLGLCGAQRYRSIQAELTADDGGCIDPAVEDSICASADAAGDLVESLLWYYATVAADLASCVKPLAAEAASSVRAARSVQLPLGVSDSACEAFAGYRIWGPARGYGPLGKEPAGCFRSSTYIERILTEPLVCYRRYGSDAGQLGKWWTTIEPTGCLQWKMDNAVLAQFGNTGENMVKICVPKGTRIYEGFAGPQVATDGLECLMGGGPQVFLPNVCPEWVVP